MAVNVSIALGYEFAVKAPASEVFEVLSDVPVSASHFPKVNQLVDLGGGIYRWEMERIGVAQIKLQTVYACKYTSSKAKGTVVWTPVRGEGNAQVSGSWQITDRKKSIHLVLSINGDLSIPLPSLMKRVVAPVVEGEFEKVVEKYIDNLAKRFGGEVV